MAEIHFELAVRRFRGSLRETPAATAGRRVHRGAVVTVVLAPGRREQNGAFAAKHEGVLPPL